MSAPTVAVTVDLFSMLGVAYAGVEVSAKLDKNDRYADGFVIAETETAITDSNGRAILHLFPNNPTTGLGLNGTVYTFRASPKGGKNWKVTAQIPNFDCSLEDIADSEVQEGQGTASTAASIAQAAAISAQASQESANESEVAAVAASIQAQKVSAHVGTTPPVATADVPLVAGREWINSNTGKKYTYYVDGDGTASWVEAAGFYYIDDGVSSASASASAAAANASKNAAAGSAAAAAASAATAAHIYPGTYATDPTTRPDGSAIQNGDQFASTGGVIKTRNLGAWVTASINMTDLASVAVGKGGALVGFAPDAADSEFWPVTSPPTSIKLALDYLAKKVSANDYNALDPKWGIIQKLINGTASVRAEIQALMDYAETRRNVVSDVVSKARVYFPGATYPIDGTLFIPSWLMCEGERANYEYFGACLWALGGFNIGTGTPGGDMVRVKSSVDPTSGASFWGGTFTGFNMRGATDGSATGGFNTVNQTGANVELQDTAMLDFLSCRFINGPGIRLYGGVPNYIRRFRPYCCNGPGILLIGNLGRHNITHIAELSGDQCHNGLLQLENWADADVCIVTAMKSERAPATHAVTEGLNPFYPILASWKDAGHDGQKNAITFKNCTGGRVVVNGVHHISAWNAKQNVSVVGDVFTMPTKSELVEGSPVRFPVPSGGTLPAELSAGVDYYAHILSPKSFQVTTTLGAVGTGPYITPGAYTGQLQADPGYLTAGDVFGIISGQVPHLEWHGAYVRYRPWPSEVERIGSEPAIISNIPAGDSTGSTPRFVTFPRSQPNGIISRDVISFLCTASSGTRATKIIVGATSAFSSGLNEDGAVIVVGNLPVLGLQEDDAPVGSKGALFRMNGGIPHITAVNETNGTFSNWASFLRNGDGTILGTQINGRLILPTGVNVYTDTTTGSSFGATPAQRIGFHGSQSVQANNAPAQITATAAATYDATTQALVNEMKAAMNYVITTLQNKGLCRAGA